MDRDAIQAEYDEITGKMAAADVPGTRDHGDWKTWARRLAELMALLLADRQQTP